MAWSDIGSTKENYFFPVFLLRSTSPVSAGCRVSDSHMAISIRCTLAAQFTLDFSIFNLILVLNVTIKYI